MDRSERFLPDGTPKYPINDRLLANNMRLHGFDDEAIIHVVGYMPDLSLSYDAPHPYPVDPKR